jgi:hypothetical protein
LVKDVTNYEKFAIQLNYDAASNVNANSNATLECSLDYSPDSQSGNWTTVANSSQQLDQVNGGIHVWNVSDFIPPFIRIVVDGNVANVAVLFAGDPQPRRG